jgi:hypothetical protein
VRRGPPQSGLPLVLPSWVGWRRPGPFDVFQEPPRPVSRERPAAQAIRDRSRALHQGKDRGRRGLRRRRRFVKRKSVRPRR